MQQQRKSQALVDGLVDIGDPAEDTLSPTKNS